MKTTAQLATKIARFALTLAAFLVMPLYGFSGLHGSLPVGSVVVVLILIYALVGAGLLVVRGARACRDRYFVGLCWRKAMVVALAVNLMIAVAALLLAWKPGVVAVTAMVFAGMLLMAGAAWAIGRSLHALWDLSSQIAAAPRAASRPAEHAWSRSRAVAGTRIAAFRRQGRVRG